MINRNNRNNIEEAKEAVRKRYQTKVDTTNRDVIPAKKKLDYYDNDEAQRVAVYARVSTDSVQQTSSYELQKNYYEDFVTHHPNWTLVDIYADAADIIGLNQNPIQSGVDLVLFFYFSTNTGEWGCNH